MRSERRLGALWLCSTVNGVLKGTFIPHGGHTHCSPTGKLLQICGLSLSCKETQPNTANQARKGKGRGKRQRASRSKVKQNEAKYKQRVYQSNVKKRLLACFLFLASNGTKQRKEQRSTAKEASGASSYGGPAWWSKENKHDVPAYQKEHDPTSLDARSFRPPAKQQNNKAK